MTPVQKALWYDVLWAIVITIVAVQPRLRGHGGGHCLATMVSTSQVVTAAPS